IRSDLEAEPGALEQLRRGQLRFERWRWLPRTLWRRYRRDPELLRHIERMGRFLRILADASGAETIVETSYNPLRGLLYEDRASGIDVVYLHLVRDGRAFIASERATRTAAGRRWQWLRSTPVVVGRWVAGHVLALILVRRSPRYLRVNYETLVRDPGACLRAISSLIAVDLSDLLDRVQHGEPIRMRHLAAGNRVRLQGELRLTPGSSGLPALGLGERAWFWGMGGWLALLLGYRPGRDPVTGPTPPAPAR
ncbi:sulfotransferase domain-containing protein, partial [mine drainage metagenome]